MAVPQIQPVAGMPGLYEWTPPDDVLELEAPVYEPDVAPSSWDLSHARRDTVTQVILAREGDATPQPPYEDLVGQKLYGIEPWQATDLVCTTTAQMDRLADRILRTRGYTTANRVERVHIDASSSDAALDLCTELSVFDPSRYRCRLELERGEVFDREMFATGVRMVMTPDTWTVDINLDLAAPWASSGGRWDEAEWNQAEWNASL